MCNRHTVRLHHVTTIYNDMFDHMDGIIPPLRKKMTELKEDLFIAVKSARQKLSKYYAAVSQPTGKFLISAHIFYPVRMLRWFTKWATRMDINPERDTFYTTQYQESVWKDVENEYCAIH